METSPFPIEVIDTPSDAILDPIKLGLHNENLAALGPQVIYNYAHFAVVARGDDGAIIGGLIAFIIWGALKIDTLWVDRAQRGQNIGSALVRRAEELARARGVSLVLLETTSFQARPFYEKLGFTVYGQIDDYPTGHTWYHMKKMLTR